MSNKIIKLDSFTVSEPRSVAFLNECNKVMVGHTRELASVLGCLLAGGHASLVTMPGLGKTLLAKVIQANIRGCKRGRVQMVPDMRPSDITGYYIETAAGTQIFRPGPLENVNVLLCDELNRASPKTLAALLQGFEEGYITVGTERRNLEEIFISISTRNDFESAGTYELGDALKDRLLIDIEWDYPTDDEMTDIHSRAALFRRDPEDLIEPSITLEEVGEVQKQVREIAANGVSPAVARYITDLTQGLNPRKEQFKAFKTPDGRTWDNLVTYGGSPRMAMALRKMSAAVAYMSGAEQVSVEHVQAAFPDVARAHILMGVMAKTGKNKVTINDFITAVLKGTTAP